MGCVHETPIRFIIVSLGASCVLPAVGFGGGSEGVGPALEFLPPGLVVATGAPEGWTHLVVKSLPVVESGDVETLPRFAGRAAARFRTVIALDVARQAGGDAGHALRRVGLGLCVPTDAGDLTMEPGSAVALERLGLIDRQILDQATRELRRARLVVSRPRLGVLRAPSVQRLGGRHVEVDVWYAFQIEATSGMVTTMVWSLPRDPASSPSPIGLRRLPAGLAYRCGLDVAARRILGAVPVSWSFAMNDLPPGEPLPVDRSLADWIGAPSRILRDPAGFEAALRRLSPPRGATP